MLSYGLNAISIYRTHEGDAPNLRNIDYLPADTVWVGVEGAIHEYFGWYGDNETDYDYVSDPERPAATISRQEAQVIIVNSTVSFLDDIDADGIEGSLDNCPNAANPLQENVDNATETGSDILGDVCDPDTIYGTISGDIQEGVTVGIYKAVCGSNALAGSPVTNSDGYYAFGGLGTGRHLLVIEQPGYNFVPVVSSWVDMPQTVVQSYDFTSVFNIYEISGTVNGDGQSGVTMTLSGDSDATTITADNGTYSFAEVVTGSYTITPNKTDYAFDPESTNVTIIDADVTGVDFNVYDPKYTAAGVLDNQIIEQAQIMTTHIEGTGIDVRDTFVEPLVFGGSYAGINAAESWVQPYFTFISEDMSAYMNAPPEINGIIMTKMKSKDIIEEEFGITLEGTQGICADVQEEIYALTYSLLSPSEQATYLAEGKSLSFIQDDRPGPDLDNNPVYQSAGWLPVDPATKITSDGDNYFYEPLSLYVSIDNPIFDDGGGDVRYRGVRYCKLLSHQAILSWFLTKSFEDDPVLITESTEECTDPRLRTDNSEGSCMFYFNFSKTIYCSDYIGYDFTPASAEEKCDGRPVFPDEDEDPDNNLPPIYSSLSCSERDTNGEIEAAIDNYAPASGYVGRTGFCDIYCKLGNEFLWNVYQEGPESRCTGYPVFYP